MGAKTTFVAGVVGLGITLAACSSDGANPEPTPSETEETVLQPDDKTPDSDTLDSEVAEGLNGGTVQRSYGPGDEPAELGGIIAAATDDLVARFGIARDSISVAGVQEVVWSNGSLGCPDATSAYPQVTSDGLRIVLESNGERYDYRSGDAFVPIFCDPTAGLRAIKDEPTSPPLDVTVDDDGEITVERPTVPKEGEGDLPTEGTNPPDD